jgi:hypothetical protein
MKRTIQSTFRPWACGLLLAASSSTFAVSSWAQAEADQDSAASHAYSLSYDAMVASRYLFQGLDYSEGNTVVQPNLTTTFGPFTLGAWGNVQTDTEALNEIDLSFKYTRAFGRWSVSPGYMLLRYPNRDWDPSQELTLDLAWSVPLQPTLSYHYDFDAGRGSYTTLGVSRTLKAPLTLAVNGFYQNEYYEMSGFPSLEIKATAPFSAGPLTVTPSLSRFTTWGNGDFVDAAGIPSVWLFAVDVAQQIR